MLAAAAGARAARGGADLAVYHFGEHRFDTARGELRHRGRTVALRPLAVALLDDLIERRARRVTRAELARRLWCGRVVTASSFSTLVAELRRALGDDGRCQGVIRTLGPHGYRFVADVRIETCPAREDSADGAPQAATMDRRHRRDRDAFGSPSDEPDDLAAQAAARVAARAEAQAAAHDVADRSLERALRDGPRHLEVVGPGIHGFVHHWACTARDRGLLVLRAHAAGGPAPSAWPWWQIAASVLEASTDAGPEAAEPGLGSLASLRPAWQCVWSELDALARGRPPLDAAAERQRRFALAHRLASALARTARAVPCALALEDLAPRDGDGRRLLRFVLLQMQHAPLWIVTSSRSPLTPCWPVPGGAPPRTDRIRLPGGVDAVTRSRPAPAYVLPRPERAGERDRARILLSRNDVGRRTRPARSAP